MMLQKIEAEVLAHVIEATPEDARAFHHSGMWDKSGFAAMGCLETLVHTGDITVGLEIAFDPPRDVCQRIIDRLLGGESGDEGSLAALVVGDGTWSLPSRQHMGLAIGERAVSCAKQVLAPLTATPDGISTSDTRTDIMSP